nr:hypothetical protein [Piscirickettsia salmonis]
MIKQKYLIAFGIEQRPAIADEKTEFGHFKLIRFVGRDPPILFINTGR